MLNKTYMKQLTHTRKTSPINVHLDSLVTQVYGSNLAKATMSIRALDLLYFSVNDSTSGKSYIDSI